MTHAAHIHEAPAMPVPIDIDAVVRSVLANQARLSVPAEGLKPTDDLYAAGMTSHASVNVMLGIEERFDIEFPEAMLKKSTFASVASIHAALREVLGQE